MNAALPTKFAAPVAAAIAALALLPHVAQASEVTLSGHDAKAAQIGDFALRVEPGVAIALTEPQARLFETGGGETMKALWVTNEYMELGPSATFLALPSADSDAQARAMWTFGGGIRFQPRAALRSSWAVSPWVDADVLYVRTGQRGNLGFAGGAGVLLPIGAARAFWFGLFARYFQIMERDRVGFDGRDAKILSAGLSLEVRFSRQRD
jgi:hypothetical protein